MKRKSITLVASPRRRSHLLAAAAALLMLAGFAAPSANGALVTYFNFNDNNLVSDAPGLQTSTITTTRLTSSFVAGTTLNQASGDLTGAGSALRLTAGASGAKTFQFTVSTTFFTNLSLSYATRASAIGFISETLTYTVISGTNAGFTGTATYTLTSPTTTFQTASFDLSGITQLNNQTSVSFTIALNPTNPMTVGSFAEFDNIQLNGTAVPEPATVVPGVLGVLGLCWHQRRRISGISRLLGFYRKTAA
jgi:hypothetical protein